MRFTQTTENVCSGPIQKISAELLPGWKSLLRVNSRAACWVNTLVRLIRVRHSRMFFPPQGFGRISLRLKRESRRNSDWTPDPFDLAQGRGEHGRTTIKTFGGDEFGSCHSLQSIPRWLRRGSLVWHPHSLHSPVSIRLYGEAIGCDSGRSMLGSRCRVGGALRQGSG
jgi:hypothetical protein